MNYPNAASAEAASAVATSVAPWYRHRWPWILMAGPFLVVVASFVTIWLAVSTDDGLVTDDYYRKGLAINQTLKMSERAEALGLQAGVTIALDSISLRLSASAPEFVAPARVRLTVSHPTRAGLDQTQLLQLQNGRYAGKFKLPPDGHWVILLEDEAKVWRIMGNMVLPASGETLFGVGADGRFNPD